MEWYGVFTSVCYVSLLKYKSLNVLGINSMYLWSDILYCATTCVIGVDCKAFHYDKNACYHSQYNGEISEATSGSPKVIYVKEEMPTTTTAATTTTTTTSIKKCLSMIVVNHYSNTLNYVCHPLHSILIILRFWCITWTTTCLRFLFLPSWYKCIHMGHIWNMLL